MLTTLFSKENILLGRVRGLLQDTQERQNPPSLDLLLSSTQQMTRETYGSDRRPGRNAMGVHSLFLQTSPRHVDGGFKKSHLKDWENLSKATTSIQVQPYHWPCRLTLDRSQVSGSPKLSHTFTKPSLQQSSTCPNCTVWTSANH